MTTAVVLYYLDRPSASGSARGFENEDEDGKIVSKVRSSVLTCLFRSVMQRQAEGRRGQSGSEKRKKQQLREGERRAGLADGAIYWLSELCLEK